MHLLKYTCGEECNDRDNRDDAHITDVLLNRMLDTPEHKGDDAHKAYPVLLHGERVPRRPYRLDLNVAFAVG